MSNMPVPPQLDYKKAYEERKNRTVKKSRHSSFNILDYIAVVFVATLLVMSVHQCSHAQQTGPANSVLRVPTTGGSAKMGPINLASPNAVTGLLGIASINGLTPGACLFGGSTGLFLQAPLASCFWSIANQALGLGTSTPNAAAVLEVASTSKGVLLPRMSSTQRDAIASPPDGLLIFNSTRGHLQQYQGLSSTWIGVGGNLGETSVAQAPQAALQVDSATRGFLGPRLTTTQRDAIATPPKGLEIFNTTTNQKNVYNGSAWVAVGSGAGGGEGVNLLTNNGGNNDAEQGTNGWTASGGTFTTTSTNPYSGLQSFTYQATAVGQFVDSTAYTVPQGFLGRKCQLNAPFVGYFTGASGDYSFQALDGSGNLLATVPVPTFATNTQNIFQAFDCPAPGTTMKIRVLSNVATPALIVFDDMFLGQGRRSINTFGAIQQALQYTGTTAIGATTTAPVKGTMLQDQAGIVRLGDHGYLSYDFKMSAVGSAGSGDYLLTLPVLNGQQLQFDPTKTTFTTTVFNSGVANANRVNAPSVVGGSHVTDGVNDLQAYIVPYDATRFRLCGVSTNVQNSNSTLSGCWGSTIYTMAGSVPLTVTVRGLVPISGWLAERAPVEGNTFDTVGWRIDANQAGTASPTVSTGTVPAGGLVEVPTSSNFTMTNIAGRGSVTALQPCTAGTAPTGATCPGVNSHLGVAFVLPQAQDVKVCLQFTQVQGLNNSGAQETYWKLYETLPTVPSTFLQGGKTTVTAYSSTVNANAQSHPMNICENFTFTSAGLKVIRPSYFQPSSTGVNDARVLADNAQGRGLRWTVEPINEEKPAPVFTDQRNKIETGLAGWRVESAQLGANCSIVNQTGFIASTTASGGNNSLCTIAVVPGRFTAPPICTISATFPTDVQYNCQIYGTVSTTSIPTSCANASGTAAAAYRNITCLGPK